MKSYDLLELAGRNLRESMLRNALTTAGISIGVASLVAMLSLGAGLQDLANRRLSKSGLFDTVYVTSLRDFRESDPDQRKQERKVDVSKARALDDAARKDLATLPGVLEVSPEVRFMGEVRYADATHAAFVAGLTQSAKENESFDGMKGRFFASATAPEAILQLDFAKDLNEKDPNSVIGQELVLRYAERQSMAGSPSPGAVADDSNPNASLGGGGGFSVVRKEQPLKIVGIIEQEPFGGMRSISRARVFIPSQLVENLNMMQYSDMRGLTGDAAGEKTYLALVVRVASAGKVQQVQDAVKKLGYRTFSILDATKGLRRFFTVLDLFLGIFGSLALAVASLAIINTLVMAVLERRREIGIMKAIGASDGDVKTLFFAEAGAMGLLGGVFGVILGWGIGRAINFGTNLWLQRRDMPPETIWASPLWLIFAAIGFSIVVSLIAGLYPAARASKLDPVQALRYE